MGIFTSDAEVTTVTIKHKKPNKRKQAAADSGTPAKATHEAVACSKQATPAPAAGDKSKFVRGKDAHNTKTLPKLPQNVSNKLPNGNGVTLPEDLKICHEGPSTEKLKIKERHKYTNRCSATKFGVTSIQQLLLMLKKEEDEDPLVLVTSADVRKPCFRVFVRVSAKRWCCGPSLVVSFSSASFQLADEKTSGTPRLTGILNTRKNRDQDSREHRHQTRTPKSRQAFTLFLL
ncbi:hypothetical protein HPB47_003091 [Ixodes persulcatus]|uniref:Uncharacterized protein n=1 Tax=Ixodes persulcatus TaxID=34615 RepID=A0AC60PJK0_IXOPE|nr:hypothetical protein HPB47_003091 [Ixodes persulcatus]